MQSEQIFETENNYLKLSPNAEILSQIFNTTTTASLVIYNYPINSLKNRLYNVDKLYHLKHKARFWNIEQIFEVWNKYLKNGINMWTIEQTFEIKNKYMKYRINT